jgi:ferredoxin
MNNGHAKIDNRDLCMECGACARNCPSEAVTVQAGVGCAAAVINAALGRDASSCCCVIEPDTNVGSGVGKLNVSKGTGCC